jgi:formate dehydrogenase subunit delta
MTVKISKLVKMAEDITANMSYTNDQEVVASKVADHLNRFWDPRMKAAIIEYQDDENSELTATLRLAIPQLLVS